MASKYQDISRFGLDGRPSVDQSGRIITGPRVIAERVAAWFMRAKGCCDWAPNRGAGLGRWLNHDFTAGELAQLPGILRREAQLEDGVRSAVVTVSRVDGGISVDCRLFTDEGEVELNVGPSGAVSILAPGGVL